MPSLSLPLTLEPCGVQGELYAPITIGTTQLKALVDTGSGALIAVQDIPNTVTYKKRPQVSEVSIPNIPLGLNCSLQCTSQKHNNCFFSQDSACELYFGTGDLRYTPVLESIQLGSLQHPAFYLALALIEQDFPFPIACIMGISHYKYSDDSPLGSLCKSSQHSVMINQNCVMFQLFQHLGGGNCLIDTQTIRLAMGSKDESVSFAVPVPQNLPSVPMVTSMLPFYAVLLSGFQVGAVKVPLAKQQVIILDSGTSSGGSLAPELYDALASTLTRYTNGLTGLSIDNAQVQGVKADKLGLFPPIAFTWGAFTHVIPPETYMIAETCGSKTNKLINLINIFSRGTDNVTILGNVCFKQLAMTFDLLHDKVYFESLEKPAPTIDVNYPSPASGKSLTMAESVQQGESVVLPAPKVRLGIPHAVIKKMASAQQSVVLNSFGAALKDNQCCLFDYKKNQQSNISSFQPTDGATTASTAPASTVWSDRNITLAALVCLLLPLWVYALVKLVVLLKKR